MVVVIGDEHEEEPAPRRLWPVPLVAVAVILAVAAVELARPADPPDPPEPIRIWQESTLDGAGVVSSISHGDLGWLASAPNERGLIALTSPDGVNWDSRMVAEDVALADSIGRGLARTVVGADRMVITVGDRDSGIRSFATSGEQWTEIPFPQEADRISALTELRGSIVAVGNSGPVSAVWALGPDGWDRAIGPLHTGRAIAVAETENGTALITAAPALAIYSGDSALDIELPETISSIEPTTVAMDGHGRVVLLGVAQVGGRDRTVVLRSVDLTAWEQVGPPLDFLGTGLGHFDDMIVVLGEPHTLWVVNGDELEAIPAPDGLLLASTSDGQNTVAVGLDPGGLSSRIWSLPASPESD